MREHLQLAKEEVHRVWCHHVVWPPMWCVGGGVAVVCVCGGGGVEGSLMLLCMAQVKKQQVPFMCERQSDMPSGNTAGWVGGNICTRPQQDKALCGAITSYARVTVTTEPS